MKPELECSLSWSRSDEAVGQKPKNNHNDHLSEHTFKLVKNRYDTKELLNIYKKIEKKIQPPSKLSSDFEDLFKKEIQSPVLLIPETPEEKKCFSTCVNSQLALSSYNKKSGSNKQQSAENANSSKGVLNTRGSKSSGFSNYNRTNTKQVRNSDDDQVNQNKSNNSTRGGFTKSGVQSRSNWKEGQKKEYNSNWRISKDDEFSTESERDSFSQSENEINKKDNSKNKTINKPINDSKNKSQYNSKESKEKPQKNYSKNYENSFYKNNRKPEWFQEDIEDEKNNSNNYNDDYTMSFDDNGKYVYSKKNTDKKKTENSKKNDLNISASSKKASIKISESSTSTTSSLINEDKQAMAKKKDINNNEQKAKEPALSPIKKEPEIKETKLDKAQSAEQETKTNHQLEQNIFDFKRIALETQQNLIDADRWFFIDAQNQIQGSFSSEQMTAWFNAGYFSMNLMIKRGKDEKFLPLNVYINNFGGRLPFINEAQVKQQQLVQQFQLQQFQNLNLLQQSLLAYQKMGLNLNPSNVNILNQLQQQSSMSIPELETQKLLNDLKAQHDSLINMKVNNSNLVQKDKLNLLLEQARREEEKRKKLEELQFKIKLKEEQRLLEEIRLKQQEETKRLEELRIKEEIRKEIQRKKLEEIIKKQEEDKRTNEAKLKKQLEEQKILKLFQKKQEELSNKSLSDHDDLKAFLEKQALEQKLLLERYRQQSNDLQFQQANSWQNFFGNNNNQF